MFTASSRWRQQLECFVRRHPFLLLVRHFCNRTAGVTSTSELDFGLGGALALLAIPGAFSAILLMGKYSSLLQFLRGHLHFNPYSVCLPDEYFFIVYSMAVTGFITLMRWDQLLPDATDFANLAPLPLSLRKIFMANVSALGILAALFAIDINLVSTLVFPLLVTMELNSVPAHLEFVFAHSLAVLGVSIFTFLALVALQGLLMAVFPTRLYRPAALAARTCLLIVFTGTLISVFLLPVSLLQVSYNSKSAGSWWPPLWFLSLFESHVGQLRSRSPLGETLAWKALVSALLMAMAGFSLSYKRHFLKTPERQTGPSSRSAVSWRPSVAVARLFRPFFRPGLETACFQFISRTLMRSETHLLFVGLWTGLGFLLTLESLRPTVAGQSMLLPDLLAPLTFTTLSLVGVRFVFDLPSAAHANWPFRLLASQGVNAVRAAARKLLLLVGLLPIVLLWFPFVVHAAGWRLAITYLYFYCCLMPLAAELLLFKFQKIPFACPFRTNRDRLLRMVIGILLFLLLGVPALGSIENSVTAHPLTLPLFASVCLGGFFWLKREGGCESETLIYEDAGNDAFVLLRLGGD
jgi:hypothetical protein